MKRLLRRRFMAVGIDYLVILGWAAVLAGVSAVVFLSLLHGYPDFLRLFGPLGTQAIFFSILTLPIGIYLYVTESGSRHATWGKRKMKIRVVSSGKGPVTRKQILVRTIVKLLPWEFAHTFIWQLQYFFYVHGTQAALPSWIMVGIITANILPLIYILLAVFSKDGRTVHDYAANTIVKPV